MELISLLPVLVIIVGAYFLFKLRFFLFKPRRMCKDFCALMKEKGAVKNLFLALSGTLGVGNIVGVAVGLKVGGAGSVFWLVLSAVPSAAIKYAESSLSVASDAKEGMMSVITESFPRSGKHLSRIYAFFVLLLALFMGGGLQCASFAEVFGHIFNTPPILFGILLVIPTALVIFFASEKIKDITAIFVSLASISYIFMALWLIFVFRENLPSAVSAIFDGAFTVNAVGGGLLGALSSRALKEGFCRGILSNEAGLGTSALAHTDGATYTPNEAGLVGVLEVFFDTAVLCPLTALVLLTAAEPSPMSPIEYVFSAVRKGGAVFEYTFAVAVFCFAFSTVVCWISYGKCAYTYFYGKEKRSFAPLFLAALPFGAILGSRALVFIVDYIMLPLAVLSMLAVMKNSDKVIGLYRSKDVIKNQLKSHNSDF